MPGADRVRSLGGAPEVDRNRWLLERTDLGREVLEAVVAALEAEGLQRGPGLLENLEVLIGAGVALVFGEEVAITALLGVVTTGDRVQRDAALGELVEGGERPGGNRW